MADPKKKPAAPSIADENAFDDEAEAALDDFDKEAEGALASGSPAAGQPLPNQRPMRLMQPGATDDRDWLDKYIADTDATTPAADKRFGEGLSDGLTGAGQGLSFGMNDESTAGLLGRSGPQQPRTLSTLVTGQPSLGAHPGQSQLAQNAEDIPRTYGAGSERADILRSERGSNAAAHERSPIAYTGGEVGGEVLASLPLTPALGPEAGWLARTGANILGNTAAGSLQAAGHSMGETGSEELAHDTGEGGWHAGAATLALDAAGHGLGALARGVAPHLGDAARYLRGKATGIFPQEAERALRNEGVEAIPNIGDIAEKRGFHKNSLGLPTSAAGFHENAAAASEASGERIGELSNWMSDVEGVAKPKTAVFNSLRGAVSSLPNILPEEQAARAAALQYVDELGKAYPTDMMTIGEIHALKTKMQKKVYEATKAARNQMSPDLGLGETAAARQSMDANMRGQMYDLVDDPGAKWGGASPETAGEFHREMNNYGESEAIRKASEKRAGRMAGYVPIGASAVLGGGAAAGMGLHEGHDNAHTAGDTALGMLAGVAAQRYGANYLASGFRGAESAANALPAIGEGLQSVPVGGAVGASAPNMSTRQDGTDDPVEGSYLSSLSPDDRATQYYILMHSDPDFRARQYARGQQQSQSTE